METLGSSIVDGLSSFFSNVVTAVNAVCSAVGKVAETIINGLSDWFKSIIKGIKDFSSSVGDWFSGLGSSLGNWFGNLIDNILSIPSVIVKGFKELLQLLFVPSDGFLNDKISSLKDKLASRFHTETYEQLMTVLKGYVAGKLDFKGYVDLSPWLKGKHLDTVKDFLRAFFYPIILLGDYKFLLWIIRGSTINGTQAED